MVEIQISRRDSISSTSSGDSGTPIDGPDDHLAPSDNNQVCLHQRNYINVSPWSKDPDSAAATSNMRFAFVKQSILKILLWKMILICSGMKDIGF